jgi:hypothetical protein
VYKGLSKSKQEKIQDFFRLKNSRIKIKLTPEGLKQVIETGRLTKIAKDSINKGKGLTMKDPAGLDHIVKGVIKDTVHRAYKKTVNDLPEEMLRNVIRAALVKKFPDKKKEIDDILNKIPDLGKVKEDLHPDRKDNLGDATGGRPPAIVSGSDVSKVKTKDKKPGIIDASDFGSSPDVEGGTEDTAEKVDKEGKFIILEVMADTQIAEHDRRLYKRLINIEGLVVKVSEADGEIALVSGNQALDLLVKQGYFVKHNVLGFVSTEEIKRPEKVLLPGKTITQPSSGDAEGEMEDDDLDLKGILGELRTGNIYESGSGTLKESHTERVLRESREIERRQQDQRIWGGRKI